MLPRRAGIGTAESLLRDPWELPRVLLKAMPRKRRRQWWRPREWERRSTKLIGRADNRVLGVIATDSEKPKKEKKRKEKFHIFVCFFPTAANTPRPSQHKKKNRKKRQPLGRDSGPSRGRDSICISTIHDCSYTAATTFFFFLLFFFFFFFRSLFFSHQLRWLVASERCLLEKMVLCVS